MKNRFAFLLLFFLTTPLLCHAQNPTLWGLTNDGGSYYGNIFSINAAGTYTDLHDFGSDTDGERPVYSLLQASNGLLYGTTPYGGANNNGVIFSYNIYTDTEMVLHDFGSGADGQFPGGLLIQIGDSLLYGTTSGGGANNKGTIFTYNIFTGVEKDIYDFDNSAGWFIQASDSLLYGITYMGGTNDKGTIFSYNVSTGIENVLYDFGNGTDGQEPFGSLMQASNGIIYGMTVYGGTNDMGTIFSYNISKGVETVLHNFGSGTDGNYPYGSLIQISDSLLYGMAGGGGTNNKGIIFSFNIYTDTEIILHNFGNGADGENPYGSLFQASNGLLYGMTYNGGIDSVGMIFSYNISTGKYSDIYDFNGINGFAPYLGSLIEVDIVYAAPLKATICEGTSVALIANGAATYTWLPSTGLNATTGDSVTANPTVTTIYAVIGTSATGYKSIAYDTVYVNPLPAIPTVTIEGDTLSSSVAQGNQWYRNDTLIAGATQQTYITTQPGMYYVIVTDSVTGCSATSNTATVTGIEQLTINRGQLTVYPNPANTSFVIQTTSTETQLMQVFDITGKLILSQNIYNNKTTIDASALADGIYFVNLKGDEGAATEKLVVVR